MATKEFKIVQAEVVTWGSKIKSDAFKAGLMQWLGKIISVDFRHTDEELNLEVQKKLIADTVSHADIAAPMVSGRYKDHVFVESSIPLITDKLDSFGIKYQLLTLISIKTSKYAKAHNVISIITEEVQK